MANMQELNIRSGYYYGYDAQSNMLMEECAELIQAMNKHKRAIASGKGVCEAIEQLTEEIADVELMIAQIKHMTGIENISINNIKCRKINRTRERIENEVKNDD